MHPFLLSLLALLIVPSQVFAQSFSDVPKSREEYQAIEELKTRGILEGRPDGTFGPDQSVNRAEAITVVVRAVANAKNLPKFSKCFPDVAGEEWYVQPVCYAKDLAWVSGYPDGTFQPVRTVSKAEFLKILLNAYGINTDPVSKLQIPLSRDVSNTSEWYYPFVSYAIASSMTRVDSQGDLNPGAALTRGQVALILHRYLLYREGRRSQDLLTNAEKDARLVFSHLDALNVQQAQFAANRVRVAAWGVQDRLPDSPVVLVTVRLGEALSSLVDAYRFVRDQKLAEGLASAKKAYTLADDADKINGGVTIYTDRVRSYSHELANEIRAYEKK